jgi:molecular chaperone GrpE
MSAADDSNVESLRDAIALLWSELEKFLKECGVSAVPTEGRRFDPDVHEAVLVQPSTEHPDSTVLSEVKPGYVFGEQVLRPAQVVVTKRPPEKEADVEAARSGLVEAGSEDDNGRGVE